MSILISASTRLIVQGITGTQGRLHTRKMQEYGTHRLFHPADRIQAIRPQFVNRLIPAIRPLIMVNRAYSASV